MRVNDLLSAAVKEIGVRESPKNSNNVKYNTEYYGGAVSGSQFAWCCTFIWWLFKKCGASKEFFDGKKTAYCPALLDWFKKKKRYRASGYAPGDIAFMNFSGKKANGAKIAEHVGVIEKVNSNGTYCIIEGNTGVGNDANGGSVMRRTRTKSQIIGAGRPNYSTELKTINDIVWELSHRGIISNSNLWLKKLKNNSPEYWLTYKAVNNTKNTDKHKNLTSVNDILWELNYRNILTNKNYWADILEKDSDVYWLARKICNMTVNK